MVEVGGIVSAVEDEAGRNLVGHGVGGDEIGLAHRHRVEAEFSRDLIDHSLEQEGRLRVSCAAVWSGRRAV